MPEEYEAIKMRMMEIERKLTGGDFDDVGVVGCHVTHGIVKVAIKGLKNNAWRVFETFERIQRCAPEYPYMGKTIIDENVFYVELHKEKRH